MIGQIDIVHIKDSKKRPGWQPVYIGRGRALAGYEHAGLGNPFTIKEYGRGNSISHYKPWIWQQYQTDPQIKSKIDGLAKRVKAGEKLELVCFCKPQTCHGDILVAFVRYLLENNKV